MAPDCSTIDARLAKARATYDNWMNGEYVSRFTDQNGETVSYSQGGMSRLTAYIAKLEAEKARFEERCRVQEERLIAMKADYDRDIADEKARTAVFIERVEAIAELEKKLKTGRRG